MKRSSYLFLLVLILVTISVNCSEFLEHLEKGLTLPQTIHSDEEVLTPYPVQLSRPSRSHSSSFASHLRHEKTLIGLKDIMRKSADSRKSKKSQSSRFGNQEIKERRSY